MSIHSKNFGEQIIAPQAQVASSPRINGHEFASDRLLSLVDATENLCDFRDIFHPEYKGETMLECPDYAFPPDQWTRAFQRGLMKLDLEGKSVYEVGVGTGINPALLLHARNPAQIYGSDINGKVTTLAKRNVSRLAPEKKDRFIPIEGDQSLACWALSEEIQFDVIYGCIPQVQVPRGVDLADGDNFANYFDPDELGVQHTDLDAYQLSLNDALVAQATGNFSIGGQTINRRPLLTPGGKIVLNLGGRPSLAVLQYLFTKHGLTPRVIHQELVAQHPETCLQALIDVENAHGKPFEFYGDRDRTIRLNAAQAEKRRGEADLYHDIYVIEGTMPV